MKLAHLLKKPMWLYAMACALTVALMAALSAVWAPQLSQWEERLASRTWVLANQDATERRLVVVDIDEKSTQAHGRASEWPLCCLALMPTALTSKWSMCCLMALKTPHKIKN